jgi:phage terminase small subunit
MTPKQAIFYGEYIKDGNGTRAAIAAGFPEKSAHVAAARMLKNAKVAAAIAIWRERQCTKLEITAERTLQELAKLAYYDPGKLYDKDGNRIPVYQLDDFTRAAVSSVEDETQETLGDADGEGVKPLVVTRKQKLKMADKGSNLERLGKHLGLFGESSFGATVETGANGLPADSTIKIVLVRPQ